MPFESFGRERLRTSELQEDFSRLRSLVHVVEREIEWFRYEFSTRDRLFSFEFPMLLIPLECIQSVMDRHKYA